jgi:hypothetical protein
VKPPPAFGPHSVSIQKWKEIKDLSLRGERQRNIVVNTQVHRNGTLTSDKSIKPEEDGDFYY